MTEPPTPGTVRPGSASEQPPPPDRPRGPKPGGPSPNPRGRPLTLDRALLQRLTEVVRVGNYLKTAAAYCGIGYSTLLLWQQRGRAQQQRLEEGLPVQEGEEIFLELVEAITTAQATAQVTALAYWRKGMSEPGNWRAAMEYLARTSPDEWGPSSTVRVSDADAEARITSAVEAATAAFLHQGDGAGDHTPDHIPGP